MKAFMIDNQKGHMVLTFLYTTEGLNIQRKMKQGEGGIVSEL